MDKLQKGIINVIHSALTGEKYELTPDFDLEKATAIVKKHRVGAIFYYGAVNCGIDTSLPLMQELFITTCRNVSIVQNQEYEIKQIFEAFDKAEIKYMPLKGTLLRKMYPKPEMRFMCDADILIHMEQYEEISLIMQELGYSEGVINDHDITWNKPSIHIELHRRLFQTFNKDYYSYFGDGWKLAKIQNGTRYEMTDEDNFIYLFVHFCKHYRATGIGIKQIIDLWVYIKSKPELNKCYIKNELNKLKLYEFYCNVMDTLFVWFEGKKENELTDFITQVIFESGVYGTHKNYIMSETLKDTSHAGSVKEIKLKKIIFSFFLPYKDMCKKYTFLKNIPVLLPIMWLVRIFSLLFKKNKLQMYAKEINTMTDKNINKYKAALNYVGLDFDFSNEE